MEPSGFALNVLEITRATLDLREQEQWLLFLMCQHVARQRSTHAAVRWVFICTWTGYLSVYIPSIYVEDCRGCPLLRWLDRGGGSSAS